MVQPIRESLQQDQRCSESATSAQIFYAKKPITVHCDASKFVLGAVLTQDDKTVSFASRSMTEAETRYAQIEKELLSVVFALVRFHQLVYGQHILVKNDHHPLEEIVKKKLCSTPPRLQHMLLRLQRYNFTLKYKSGKELILVDMLSRPCTSDTNSSTEEDVIKHLDTVVNNIPVSRNRVQDIKFARRGAQWCSG